MFSFDDLNNDFCAFIFGLYKKALLIVSVNATKLCWSGILSSFSLLILYSLIKLNSKKSS